MIVMPAERETVLKTADFYSHIFGIEFSRTWTDLAKVFYAPISIDATMFGVEWRQRSPNEKTMPFPLFAVDDLDTAEQELVELGGQMIDERFELPIAEQGLARY